MTVLAASRHGRVAGFAWALATLILLVLTAAVVLLVLNHRVMSGGKAAAYGFGAAAVVVYAGVGGLIASRRPGNAIGWLLSLLGLALATSMFLEQYGLYGLATAPGSLPAVRDVTALGQAAQMLTVAPLILLVLLFPDGRLPSRRWRPALWGAIEVAVVGGFGQLLQRGLSVSGSLTNALQPAHVAYPNPLGVFPRHGVYSALIGATFVIAVVTTVAAIASVFVRRRGASAELRQQLAWLGYVGLLTLGGLLVLAIGSAVTHGGGESVLSTLVFALAFGIPIFGVPVACAVAVLKYRLYDLDVVVRRTVIAAAVAAVFTAIYVLVVIVVGALTGRPGNSTLTFIAAALAAVALQPVRSGAGRLADRLVYGKRATPYEVLSEFAERMAGGYSTDEVLPSMARMLVAATGAERAEVWLRAAGTDRLEAAWPAPVAGLPPAVAEFPGSPAVAGNGSTARHAPAGNGSAAIPHEGTGSDGRTHTFQVEHRGERLGALRLTTSPREPLTPAGDRLVRDVAAQAGLVLRNVALIEDLRASRQRLVVAGDEARRRLERNLHDGAQQQLVALRITLGLARELVRSAPGEADDVLAQTEQEAAAALEELRDLARGIYPPLLADLGLCAALEAQARKAALPVSVQAAGLGRYAQDVEAAVYFCVLEALQNAAKYAQASTARVDLRQDGGTLVCTVTDDGVGFDPAATAMGSGVQGMSDRLAALGGSVDVRSARGAGTTVTGRIPAQLR